MSSPLHPVLVQELVGEHQAELRRQLRRHQYAPPRDHRYRRQVGWLLVEAGLRLAVEPAPGEQLHRPRR